MSHDRSNFRFPTPVLCLTPENLSHQLREWGEVIRPELNSDGLFELPPEGRRGKIAHVAVLQPALSLLETLIGVSRLFREAPTIMTNAEDLGAYEVILRGYRGEEQVFYAHSTRFNSDLLVPADFEMSVFYMGQEHYPAVLAMLQILLAGRSFRACYRMTNGACGARYWDPQKEFKKFSASKVVDTPLSRLAEESVPA